MSGHGFCRRLAQSVASVLLTIVIVVLIVVGGAYLVLNKKTPIKAESWLVLDLAGDLPAYAPAGSLPGSLLAGDTLTLQDALDAMGKAALDKRVSGVVWKLAAGHGAGWGKLQELRDGITAVRDGGKPVYAWAETLDLPTLYLAAACDSIYQPRGGYCEVRGLMHESMHVRGLLAKLGVTPYVSKLREYKSAAEMLTETRMTAPAREQAQRLLDHVWEAAVAAITRERDLSREQLLALMEQSALQPTEAAAAGLIDRVLYWQDLEAQLLAGAKGKGKDKVKMLPTISPAAYRDVDWSKLGPKGRETVAVIHAQGMIGGRESGMNPLLGLTMGHESIVRELRRARQSEKVKAIVLRVDSGGGESLTSDLIRREVELCAAAKPTVVSMVDVAASGGYMISYCATKLLANPLSVTGSIGSISAFFDASGLYERLGVGKDAVTVGPMAELGRDARAPTPAEWQAFERAHIAGFEDWMRGVAEHRNLTFAEVESRAYGRVFTGAEAAANGLIDGVGNLQAAVREAASLAGIAPEVPLKLVHLPEPTSPLQQILGGGRDSGGELSAGPAATVAAWLRWELYRLVRHDLLATVRLLRSGSGLVD
jgi:protease-4